MGEEYYNDIADSLRDWNRGRMPDGGYDEKLRAVGESLADAFDTWPTDGLGEGYNRGAFLKRAGITEEQMV